MKHRTEKEFLLDAIAFQDGSLDPARIPDFEDTLRSSKSLRAAFIRQQLLCSQYMEIQHRNALLSSPSLERNHPQSSVIIPWRKLFWSILSAACIALLLWVVGPRQQGDEIDGIIITHARSVSWSGLLPRNNRIIEQGKFYSLHAGVIRLKMPAGAVVSIAAPAVFSALNEDTIDLVEGKIAARMPTEKSSLRIIINGMLVTDLGTAFGVSASPEGESNVSVFEGRVSLESVEFSATPPITLRAGGSVFADGTAPVPIDQEMFDSTRYQEIWPFTAGVDEVSSIFEFVPPGPISNLEFLQNDQKLFILAEQLDIVLPRQIETDHTPDSKSWPTNSGKLSAGSSLRSYLLFFNPGSVSQDRVHRLQGSVVFSKPIIGLIFESEKLEATDAILGLETLDYGKRVSRGLENGFNNKNVRDTIRFSNDGKELFFDLNVGRGVDSFRVLVSAE